VISRLVERVLSRFNNEDRELILRWRIWKMHWLPYRTAEWIKNDQDEMVLGPWKWHLPDKITKKWP
jgi:hypothetical protein